MLSRLNSPKVVAAYLGLSYAKVRAGIRSGQIKSVTIGSRRYVTIIEVKRLMGETFGSSEREEP
jgi:hypothetical protein